MCVNCNYRDAINRKARYDMRSDAKRENVNKKARERKEKYQAEGRCSCGNKITDKRYKLCLECRLYAKRKQAEYRKPKRFKEIGLCVWCGKEVAEDTIYCSEHLQFMRELAERNFRPNGVNIADNSYFRWLNHAYWEERKANKIQRESQ